MNPATTHDPDRARLYRERGQWPGLTLCDALDGVAERTPHKVAVVAGTCRLTYRELLDQSETVASRLAGLGVGHGDAVSIQLPNSAEFVIAHVALTRLGAITVPLLPIYRARELAHILEFARVKVAIIPSMFRGFSYTGLYRELHSALPLLEQVFVVGGGSAGFRDFAELTSNPLPSARRVPRARFNGDDVTSIMFTSGTESTPKGVMHSHNTLMFANVSATKLLNLTADEVVWAASPIAHATGFEWNLRQALVLGGTVVLQDVWDAEAGLALIERERCTMTTGATPFATMLLDAPSVDRRDLRSFRVFLCGGAPIPPKLGETMRQRIGCTLIGVWGMSECFIASISTLDDSDHHRFETDGAAMAGTELAIFDAAREVTLPPGEVGEIATRGPHVCLGYFNDPQRTTNAFSPDGWLFSGDLGVQDAEGYLRVVGRTKDVINRGGLKISAREIEDLLSRHPGIRAVAVVGVPDPRLGEKACAFVVGSDDAAITLSQLTAYLQAQGLSAYKLPEHLVRVDELPMTATGKIQKFKLRQAFEACQHASSD